MTLKLEATTKERELHMENLWKSFQQVLHSFLLYTEEFRDEYIDLRNRDAEETRSIQDHYNGENIEHIFFNLSRSLADDNLMKLLRSLLGMFLCVTLFCRSLEAL